MWENVIVFRQQWRSMAQTNKLYRASLLVFVFFMGFVADKNNIEYHPTYPLSKGESHFFKQQGCLSALYSTNL